MSGLDGELERIRSLEGVTSEQIEAFAARCGLRFEPWQVHALRATFGRVPPLLTVAQVDAYIRIGRDRHGGPESITMLRTALLDLALTARLAFPPA